MDDGSIKLSENVDNVDNLLSYTLKSELINEQSPRTVVGQIHFAKTLRSIFGSSI